VSDVGFDFEVGFEWGHIVESGGLDSVSDPYGMVNSFLPSVLGKACMVDHGSCHFKNGPYGPFGNGVAVGIVRGSELDGTTVGFNGIGQYFVGGVTIANKSLDVPVE
jgi:hypothetical protein